MRQLERRRSAWRWARAALVAAARCRSVSRNDAARRAVTAAWRGLPDELSFICHQSGCRCGLSKGRMAAPTAVLAAATTAPAHIAPLSLPNVESVKDAVRVSQDLEGEGVKCEVTGVVSGRGCAGTGMGREGFGLHVEGSELVCVIAHIMQEAARGVARGAALTELANVRCLAARDTPHPGRRQRRVPLPGTPPAVLVVCGARHGGGERWHPTRPSRLRRGRDV